MQDRAPLYPGRVKLTPVAGQEYTYDMTRADQPTQEGTPLNKASLLKDATAALFGFGSDAVPDDMLNALAHTGDLHVWKRTQNGQVDYPVSPNPNSYQEGSDKQPAGYTLGEEISIGRLYTDAGWLYISNSVEVSDDGSIVANGTQVSYNNVPNQVKGKYIYSNPSSVTMYYVPSDANVSYGGDTHAYVTISKGNLVTGYPAIPANTTIEYIGQIGGLGGDIKMIVASYVGTGTHGQSSPCSITAPFFIDVGFYVGEDDLYPNMASSYSLSESFSQNGAFSVNQSNTTQYAKRSSDGKTISWYVSGTRANEKWQLNNSGQTYYFVLIGR